MKKLLFLLLLACGLAHAESSVPDLTAEQWQEDLDFLANEIATRHRDPFHFAGKAGFDLAVSDLRGRIPSMKDYEVVAGLQRLAVLVGDGHTLAKQGSECTFQLRRGCWGVCRRTGNAGPSFKRPSRSYGAGFGSGLRGILSSRIAAW